MEKKEMLKNYEMFTLLETEQGVIIVLGKYRISKKTFDTFENAKKYLKTKPWDVIINTLFAIQKFQDENKVQADKE